MSTAPPILRTARDMRAFADERAARGETIGLVPTMGYLHEGHLSLVELARARAKTVVASIFVNPTQFAPHEDLERYPRDLEGDVIKLAGAGVDAVFAPAPREIYPAGFDTYITPGRLAEVLCGRSRPGHFRGVATVVHLLLCLTRARVAVFGEKDYQQLAIIRRMVRDLWLDVEIIGAPIVREHDGLAKSSRNGYLSADERRCAPVLSAAVAEVAAAFAAGERDARRLEALARARLATAPGLKIDYVEVVDALELCPTAKITKPAVCAVAAYLGATRLIDNVKLSM